MPKKFARILLNHASRNILCSVFKYTSIYTFDVVVAVATAALTTRHRIILFSDFKFSVTLNNNNQQLFHKKNFNVWDGK